MVAVEVAKLVEAARVAFVAVTETVSFKVFAVLAVAATVSEGWKPFAFDGVRHSTWKGVGLSVFEGGVVRCGGR